MRRLLVLIMVLSSVAVSAACGGDKPAPEHEGHITKAPARTAPAPRRKAAVAAQPVPADINIIAPAAKYICSMHPEVVSDKPGRCPRCGMTLVPVKPAADDADSHPAAVAEGKPAGSSVNVNTATLAELDAVDGVNEATAGKIIAARQSAGNKFSNWDEIDAVSGVGASTLEKLKTAFELK